MAKSDSMRTIALVNGASRLIGYAKVSPEEWWTGPRNDPSSGATLQVKLFTNTPDQPTDGSVVFDPVSQSFFNERQVAELAQMRGAAGAPGGTPPRR